MDYRVYLSRRGDSKKPGVCKLPVSETAFVVGWTHRLVVFSRFHETGFRRRVDSQTCSFLPVSETAFAAGWTHRLVVFSRFPETGFRSNVEEGTLGNRGRPKTQSFLKTLICLENLFLHTQYNRFCSI